MPELKERFDDVKNPEDNATQFGGVATEATKDASKELGNESGGFADEVNGDVSEDSIEDIDEEAKKGIINGIKEFLANHSGEVIALGSLGYEGYKLLKALQGDPQCPGSSVDISKEMMGAAWHQVKAWWETRNAKESIDITKIDSPYGMIDMDTANHYQFSDVKADESKIGFDFDD